VSSAPLHCLHVVSGDLWAGAEVSAFHLINELHRRPDVKVEAAVLNRGELHDRLDTAGVPVHLLDESRHGVRELARELARVAEASGVRLLHSHRYKEHVIAALAARRRGLFHLRSAHGRPSRALGPWIDRAIGAWTGSDWIAVSEDLAADLCGPRQRVTVIPNGIPVEAPRPDRSVFESAFGAAPSWWVGFVGRFEQVKRPDRFVRLIEALPERIGGRHVRGVMLGDGGLFRSTQQAVTDAGLDGRILLTGHRRDAERLLAALDLLVIPSDHEGDPMVLHEAMRSRVPVAGSRVGSLASLGDVPWIAPVGDDPALAAAVRRLFESDVARGAWSAELHDQFLRNGTVTTSADRMLELYRRGLA
jgi:glycosyltransferase involved in cell wall biosynthesis